MFIKDKHFFDVNDFVESTREIVVTDGKFTRGHIFKVVAVNEGSQRDPGKTYKIFCSETKKEVTVTPSDIVRYEKGSYYDR